MPRRAYSLRRGDRDPKGGLTPEGRRRYNAATGSNLKPGVRGPANTPEKLRRKGSFLRRMFAPSARGPLINSEGQPTRRALSARAWGEAAPRTAAAEAKLYAKGKRLLERYAKTKRRP